MIYNNNILYNYKDLTYIQRGGTAYILKAKNIYNDKNVIIKLPIDKNKQDHLLNENKILSKIYHNNIVRLLDVNHTKHQLYLILELLEGMTLQAYVEKNHPLEYDHILQIYKQICTGVNHIHNLNIVHRDLNPRNIFVCDDQTIKIIDFGLSGFNNSILNYKNKINGNIDYASPEQLMDSRYIYKFSDIYSLAAILYFLSTNKTMFIDKDKNLKIRKKFLGYHNKLFTDNIEISNLFFDIINFYNHKTYSITDIITQINLKEIIYQYKC